MKKSWFREKQIIGILWSSRLDCLSPKSAGSTG